MHSHDQLRAGPNCRILESEEEHVDHLDKQFDMIKLMGIQNYIQLQSRPAGETTSFEG